jgi:hypothetical protein
MLLLLGNDDIVSVPASVDDSPEIARGGVIEVAFPPPTGLSRPRGACIRHASH